MVLAAHPIDVALGAGGVLAWNADRAEAIRVWVATDRAGAGDPAEARRRILNAGRELGLEDFVFAALPQRELALNRRELTEALGLQVAAFRPDLILAPSPAEVHADRRVLGETVFERVARSRVDDADFNLWRFLRVAFYEISAPLLPNVLFHLGDTDEKKNLAIALLPNTGVADWGGDVSGPASCRGAARERSGSVEAFRQIEADEIRLRSLEDFRRSIARVSVSQGRAGTVPVAVVIRTRNRPALLREALESVAAQTARPRQVVVVNDGGISPAELVQPYQQSFDVVVREEPSTRGRSWAANAGVEAATQELIAFLDDDDRFYPDHLERLWKAHRAGPEPGVYSDAVTVVYEWDGEAWKERHRGLHYSMDFDPDYLLFANYIPIHTLLLPTLLYRKIGGFDAGMEYSEDWDFLIRLTREAALRHVRAVTCEYRVFEGDASHAAAGSPPFQQAREQIYARYRGLWTEGAMAKVLEGLRREALRWAERERAGAAEAVCLRARHRQVTDLLARFQAEKAALAQGLGELSRERETLAVERDTALRFGEHLQAEKSRLKVERHALELERDEALRHGESLQAEKARLAAERDAIVAERDEALRQSEYLQAEKARLAAERDAVTVERDAIAAKRDAIAAERDALAAEKDEALRRSESLRAERTRLENETEAVQARLKELQARADEQEQRLLDVSQDRQRLKGLLDRVYGSRLGKLHLFLEGLRTGGIELPHEAWASATASRQTVGFWNRLWIRSTLAARYIIVGHTRFGPQYEWLARRLRGMWAQARSGLARKPSAPIDAYDAWLEVNRWNGRAEAHLVSRLEAYRERLPTISVVMPVFDPEVRFLEAAVGSVARQVYGNWELCVADDHSRNAAVRAALARWAAREPRVRLSRRSQNGGVSVATNTAASMASGEFLLFLDHDDELDPGALGEVALYVAQNPGIDFLYSDDDKIDTRGRRYAPQFKPNWSPELLLSYMYLSHLCAVRRRTFMDLGGFREGFEGAQDYDFALRATRGARHVGHIPLVLYHWRSVRGSTAFRGSAKKNGFAAAQRALQEDLAHRGVPGRVYRPAWAEASDVGIFEREFLDDGPQVAILIPTRNRPDLLRRCLASLEKTTYRDYRVIVVDNESDDPTAVELLRSLPHSVLRIPNPGPRFNFAAIMNRAVERADGEFVVFLNDDTEVLSPGWLSQMVGYGRLPGVGAVGAKLIFPDGRVQHAGVVRGVHHGLPGHAFKMWPAGHNGYLSYAQVTRNCSAVTAACLLTPRRLFWQAGGFDEERFGVAYNDVDYCLRLDQMGYRSVYCPSAQLLHHEGASRGFVDDARERAEFRRRYPDRSDRYYSPHLRLDDAHCAIQPRRVFCGEVGRLRALMWSHALDLTGAPLHQYELTAALASQGAISPVVISVGDGPLGAAYARDGIPLTLRPHPLRGAGDGNGYLQVVQRLAAEIRSLGVDIVYANTLDSFFVIEAAAAAGLPSVWNVHESEPLERYFRERHPGLAAQARRCFELPYRVVFVSDAGRAVYADLDVRHRAMVIHNAVDPRRIENTSAGTRQAARESWGVGDEVVVLALGTVCERKGQHDLVRALGALPPEVWRRLRCFIVGDRGLHYGEELRRLVAALPTPLRERTSVVDETPETGRFYQAADMFVCTSREESFPRTILEAMAYGLPIATTPVFGIPEQVQKGVNGLFYTPGAVAELAAVIRLIVEDEALRKRLGENAKHVLATLNSFDEMTETYAQAFREAYLSAGQAARRGPVEYANRSRGSGARAMARRPNGPSRRRDAPARLDPTR